jgi:hypothetical protein
MEKEVKLEITNNKENYLLLFQKDDKKSYFDYKDGKWQFWGDLEIEESAKLFWESVGGSLTSYIKDNFIMVDGNLEKKCK